MTKKKDLASALAAQDEAIKEGQGSEALKNPRPVRAASREGEVSIGAWFPLKVRLELEELRLERSRKLGKKVTLQQLQAEAFNDLFKKYGRAEIAPLD